MNNRFQSPAGGHQCTPAQYLAEIIVQREINKTKAKVPIKWWNHGEWKKRYAGQVVAANALLKKYEPRAILNALKRYDCSWQWSLREKNIKIACKEEQEKLDKLKVAVENSNANFSSATTTEVKKFGKPSKIDKLR